MFEKRLILIIGVGCLGGCAALPLEEVRSNQSDHLVQQKLLEAAMRIEQKLAIAYPAQKGLGAASLPTPEKPLVNQFQKEERQASVDLKTLNREQSVPKLEWYGEVEALLLQLSQQYQIPLQIYGTKPASPLLISLQIQNQPIYEVLKTIGMKTGKAADIVLNTGIVELRYAN